MEARSRNYCFRAKVVRIKYSQFVFVASGIRHAIRMRSIVLSSVTCPALQYISILSQKRHGSCKKSCEHEMCVLIFSTTFFRNIFSLREIEGGMIKNVYGSSCK